MNARNQYVERSDVKRRHEQKKTQFPKQLDTGEIVLRDRRINPDRRKDGIMTQEIEISAEEFEELFEAFGH